MSKSVLSISCLTVIVQQKFLIALNSIIGDALLLKLQEDYEKQRIAKHNQKHVCSGLKKQWQLGSQRSTAHNIEIVLLLSAHEQVHILGTLLAIKEAQSTNRFHDGDRLPIAKADTNGKHDYYTNCCWLSFHETHCVMCCAHPEPVCPAPLYSSIALR